MVTNCVCSFQNVWCCTTRCFLAAAMTVFPSWFFRSPYPVVVVRPLNSFHHFCQVPTHFSCLGRPLPFFLLSFLFVRSCHAPWRFPSAPLFAAAALFDEEQPFLTTTTGHLRPHGIVRGARHL